MLRYEISAVLRRVPNRIASDEQRNNEKAGKIQTSDDE